MEPLANDDGGWITWVSTDVDKLKENRKLDQFEPEQQRLLNSSEITAANYTLLL